MTIEEKLERLTNIVDSLAAAVVARANRIEAHDKRIEALVALAAPVAEFPRIPAAQLPLQ